MFARNECSLPVPVCNISRFSFADKQKTLHNLSVMKRLSYPKRDLNPHSHHWPRDFKSLVSTDSTIRASYSKNKSGLSPSCLPIPPSGHPIQRTRAENETRTRDPNLGKVVLYQLSYFRVYGCKCREFYFTLQTFSVFSFKMFVLFTLFTTEDTGIFSCHLYAINSRGVIHLY